VTHDLARKPSKILGGDEVSGQKLRQHQRSHRRRDVCFEALPFSS
jgi:hypothetical protein